MHFHIQREDILKALRAVAGVVERRQAMLLPILSNVLLQASGQTLRFITTDQEIQLVASASLIQDIVPGETTVSFRKLMDVCRVLEEKAVLSCQLVENKLLLTTEHSRFTLATLPAETFPVMQDKAFSLSLSMEKDHLKQLLEHTSFAIADQDVRAYLNGLLLEVKDNTLHACSADGHRLAFGKVKLSLLDVPSVRLMVPRKGVFELFKLLDSVGEIQLKVGDNHLKIETSDVILTCQLLEGRFPDYTRLIPTGDKIVYANREMLREALLRASVVLDEKCRGVRLRFEPDSLMIAAQNSEQDTVEETMPVEYSGVPLMIAFNVKYLLDFLNIVTAERIHIQFSDANHSALFQAEALANFYYVVMPMRV